MKRSLNAGRRLGYEREKVVDILKLPRLKDRCKLCGHIAKRDSLFGRLAYFWFRRGED